ncbi:hypothetical protein FE783_05900 [Paenibacillus mesophilus]|uniref:hypothetical protein n=1 Tax=Paenibacillus mesophilus TaxID=2582849 RepID=UPI00110E143B|nr:hypothetical protein [Paenibacillus mesophilus]TMV51315.1 hypothetical protein FE783_05900 [Paenibacillus mesophilus]
MSNIDDERQQSIQPTRAEEYEAQFVEVSNRVERLLRRAIWTGLALLIAAQLLLSVPSIRQWAVKVERLEGIPFERSGPGHGS